MAKRKNKKRKRQRKRFSRAAEALKPTLAELIADGKVTTDGQGKYKLTGAGVEEAARIKAAIQENKRIYDAAKASGLPIPVPLCADAIRIGALTITPAGADAAVPIFPLIELWFQHRPLTGVDFPDRLHISWEGMQYRVFEPGKEATPIAEREDPTPPDVHQTFQRLWKHWDYWLLRIHGNDGQWDFQVVHGGQVKRLLSSPADQLGAVTIPRDRLIAETTAELQTEKGYTKEAAQRAATGLADKLEALVGPLPIAISASAPAPAVSASAPPTERLLPLDSEAKSVLDAAPDDAKAAFRDTLRAQSPAKRMAHIPIDRTRTCGVSGCTQHPPEYHHYCAEHAQERAATMPRGEFLRTIRSDKPSPPCYRCGKFGPRSRYLVRIDGKQREVCMDCADEIGASEMFQGPSAPLPYDVPRLVLRPRTPEDDTRAMRALHKWRLERYFEHLGVDPENPEIKLRAKVDGVEQPTERAQAVFDAQLAGRTPDLDVVFEVPLRAMVGHNRECQIVYLPREGAREAIDKIIGAPTEWVFSPPDRLVIRHHDPMQAGKFPLVMLCADPDHDGQFQGTGPMKGPIYPRDLTDVAERAFRNMFAQAMAEAERIVGEIDKDTHQGIIYTFMQLCNTVRMAAMANDENAKRVWPLLRDAVIFEMPPIAYETLWEEFFRYVVRSAGVDPELPVDQHTEKQKKAVLQFVESGRTAPYPEKLPFPASFFAYGVGVDEPGSALLAKETQSPVGLLYGHLVCADGTVVAFRHVRGGENGHAREGIMFTFEHVGQGDDAKWDRPTALTPWIVNALVDYVNEHQTLIEQGKRGFGYSRFIKRTAKQMGVKPPIPPPYYVVYIKDQLIRERARSASTTIKRHIDWQHRWRVRGHWCVRFERGPLPLDPEKEAELRKRRYQIFTVTQPDAELFADLMKRGIPAKRTDEWLAVLKYWRDDFVKGPEDKPLIESVRRSTKKWKVG